MINEPLSLAYDKGYKDGYLKAMEDFKIAEHFNKRTEVKVIVTTEELERIKKERLK